MDLNNLIPIKFLNNSSWVIKGNFLMFKKYEHIPLCFIDNDVIYVFLDNKIPKIIISLVKHLISMNVEFYFTTPELSNPNRIKEEVYNYLVIKHYLFSYVQDAFFYGFSKIEFDLIDNMIKWTTKENCFDMVKNIYDEIHIRVERKEFDYYSNKYTYAYSDDIREDFQSLYRHIQISKII